jgi:N-methylhydantoinase B
MKDLIELDVVYNALAGISDAMAVTLVRTSRSSIVRLAWDFSTGLLSPRGELVGQGLCQPIHMGGMPPALHACLRRYEGQIRPGDILINNDPYEGGSHLPDVFMFKPVFAGDTLVAWACAMSHQTDMGGRVAGSNASDSTEIYQEGLRIPPLKLYEEGRPNEALFRILEKAVRVPDKVLGDVRGQVTALRLGEQELLRLAERYGADELLALQEELLDHTERLTRLGIGQLPDGQWSFTDYIDDDGFDSGTIAIVAHLAKAGDEIRVDFTGTSPQVAGAINTPLDSTKSMVYAVVRTVLGGDIPNTGGYFRPVTVTAPEGTYVNPLPPAPVAARYLGCLRVSQAVFGAFAMMLPERVPACTGGCDANITFAGYHRNGLARQAWIQVEGLNEVATGGSATRDGMDAQSSPVSNITNIPAELIEVDHPIRIEEYALIPDSEGVGRSRGGLGLVRHYRFLAEETLIQLRADRMKHPPYGLSGGQPSQPTRVTLIDGGSGATRAMPSKFIVNARRGDALRLEMPGGGGWGDPLSRDPARVVADVVAEKVTPARAETVYGVVVDTARRQVDTEATQRRRCLANEHR